MMLNCKIYPRLLIYRFGLLQRVFCYYSTEKSSDFDYCAAIVKRSDYENYLCTLLLPAEFRRSVFAVRAFNCELATIREAVSNPTVGLMRLKFWADALDKIMQTNPPANPPAHPPNPPAHPVAAELSLVAAKHKLSKMWLKQLIESREWSLHDRPFRSLPELEDYCSKTTTSMLYLTLEILDVRTVDADHVASHVGKAVGIVNSLRSIPFNARRNQVLLPIDLLLLHGVPEEDIIRKKSTDAVRNLIHDIASQAQIHLEHARKLAEKSKDGVPKRVRTAMLCAVIASNYLNDLQKFNFDVFNSFLNRRNNWLPLLLFLNKIRETIATERKRTQTGTQCSFLLNPSSPGSSYRSPPSSPKI